MRAGLQAGEVLQGAVVEDDVRGDVPLPCELEPERAQRLEYRTLVVAEGRRRRRRCTSAPRLGAGRPQRARLAIQHGVAGAAEQRDAVGVSCRVGYCSPVRASRPDCVS